ncbi:MAG: hypothetical protein ACOY4K_06570 [Pseudomonadota bacterium]
MADQPPEPFLAGLKLIAPYVPGFAGAVLALAFLEKLTPRGRIIAVAVGLAAAAFLGPALSALADLFWPGAMPREVDGAIKFLTGLLGMGCLPPFLGWTRKVAGDPLNLLKIQIGPVGVSQPQPGVNTEEMP